MVYESWFPPNTDLEKETKNNSLGTLQHIIYGAFVVRRFDACSLPPIAYNTLCVMLIALLWSGSSADSQCMLGKTVGEAD